MMVEGNILMIKERIEQIERFAHAVMPTLRGAR